MSSNSTQRNFSLTAPRFPQDTYLGRFRHFLDVTDPRTLFTTDEQLKASIKLLEDYKTGTLNPSVTDEQLWQARKIKDSVLHPDTGEKIFPLFRFSAFAPANIPIVAGLLLPNASVATTIFWQWLNQSYNVAVNYANRNATNPMSNQQIAQAYGAAVGASCGIAVGMGALVKRAGGLNPTTATLIRCTVPFLAVAGAGVMNVLLIRKNELQDGIDVYDPNDNTSYGKSKIAGQKALAECCLSRVAWSALLLVFPPALMSKIEKHPKVAASPRLKMAIELGIITGSLWLAVPSCIALFPQQRRIDASKLEPQFHNLINPKTGSVVSSLLYNKGL